MAAPEGAVLQITQHGMNDEPLLAAITQLVDVIDVTMMRGENLRASGGNNTSHSEAARWLWTEIQRKR